MPRKNHPRSVRRAAEPIQTVSTRRPQADSGLQSPHRLAHLQPTPAPANQLAQQMSPDRAEHELGDTPRSGAADLPEKLQTNIEAMSGHSLAGVRVFRGSGEPAQLHAHAFTRGTDIHLAPGQDRHLAHEAWHVVQQLDGRVQADSTVGEVGVNTSPALESEADRMGQQALSGAVEAVPEVARPAEDPGTVQRKHAPEAQLEAALPLSQPMRVRSEVVQCRSSLDVVQMEAPNSVGLEKAKASTTDKSRLFSKRMETEGQDVYDAALRRGATQLAKLPTEQMSSETAPPSAQTTTTTAGALSYEHDVQVSSVKDGLIAVSTTVFLTKNDSFEPTQSEDLTEDMSLKERRKAEQRNEAITAANEAGKLRVGFFKNTFRVKGGEVREVKAGDNARTSLEQEGGRSINMTDVIRQQATVATNFKNEHVQGWFKSWASADKVDAPTIEGEQEPGQFSDDLVFTRTPNPNTDTALVMAYISQHNISDPDRHIALWGTAHANAPFYIALQKGIPASALSVMASQGGLQFKLGDG